VETGFVFDPSVGTQTLTYTYTDANNCTNNTQVLITVNDLPVVTAGTYGPVCIDGSDVVLGGSPAGGLWSGTGVSGSVETGFVFDPSVGTQTLTYTYSDANSCVNSSQTTITVNNLPLVESGTYAAVCIDAADVMLGGIPTGGVWSGTGVSGSVETGFVFDPSVGTQTLTYTYTDTNTCVNTSQVTITVYGLPEVDPGIYPPVCSNAVDVILGGSPTGGEWTGTGVSGSGFSGYTFDPTVGSQTLIYTYIDGNSCKNTGETTIIVNNSPLVDPGVYTAVCTESPDIQLFGSPSGGIWSGIGVSGNIENGFVFDPSVGTQFITYNYSDTNACSDSAQILITVNPTPLVDAGTYGPVCENSDDIQLGGTPIGGIWSGIGVSGSLETGFMFDPSVGTQTLYYSYTNEYTCTGVSETTITIHEIPVIHAGNYGPVELNAPPVALSGIPVGGIFSGPGVSGNQFLPSIAGLGNHLLTYVYSTTNGCIDSATTVISVFTGWKDLQISTLLQGLYDGSQLMHEAKDESGNPKWGLGIADHVTIELHDGSNYSTVVYSISNVPLSTAGVVSLTGASGIPAIFNGFYFITIKHRNSIETTSSAPVSFADTFISYAFDMPAKAYGANLLQMPDGVFVVFGGDVNADGLVDSSDMILVDNDTSAFAAGYLNSDLNGDGLVDSSDMILVDNNTGAFVTSILP
jgi:hypothetical protein